MHTDVTVTEDQRQPSQSSAKRNVHKIRIQTMMRKQHFWVNGRVNIVELVALTRRTCNHIHTDRDRFIVCLGKLSFSKYIVYTLSIAGAHQGAA